MKDEQLQTSKAYQALNQEEPISSPPELDAAILARAHQAVQAKPHALQPSRHLTLRWGAPIASAALVVLSVTVVILLPELEQQAVLQSEEQRLAADSAALIDEDQQAQRVSQRRLAKAMKKDEAQSPATLAPMASGMPMQRFAGASEMAMDSMAEQEYSEVLAPETVLGAEPWVEKIQQLIAQQQWQAADKQFKAFAKHYPEHAFIQEYARLK